MIPSSYAWKNLDYQTHNPFLQQHKQVHNPFKASFDTFKTNQLNNVIKAKKPLFAFNLNSPSFTGAVHMAEGAFKQVSDRTEHLKKVLEEVGVIIDEFKRPTVSINGNPIADYAHGSFLAKLANIFAPEARNLLFPSRTTAQTLRRLKQVNKLVDQGANIKAVNLSIGIINNTPTLSNNLRMYITPDNIRELRPQIIQSLRNNGDLGYLDTANSIDEIEKLVNKGVKVFVCAGNGRPDTVNLNSLAKGANVVSAVDNMGHKSKMFAENSLTTDYELGYITSKEIKDNAGNFKGLSVTGNDVVEIPASEIKHHFSFFKAFVGKRPDEVLASYEQHLEFINFQKQGKTLEEAPLYLKEKLYSVDTLKSLLANDPMADQHYYLHAIKNTSWEKAYCPISPFFCYDYSLKPNLWSLNGFFDINNATGLLQYSDTLYSNVPKGVNGVANGTSYSSVIKYAKYLHELSSKVKNTITNAIS